ncbi:hypothetical protein ACQUW5_02855 [Legionella sp. CNM-1927-20]|uniref:hypothetical protein n=1 Tax=Legionella sp. CNM-1927-20 TaxID=3422221 RepID=UPI00403B0F02
MKQTVKVSKGFSNLSNDIQICAIYQKEDTLIAVAKIVPTGNMGEAICTRKDSKTVETNADHVLPVRSIFIGQGQSLENINAIKGLQALPVVASGLTSSQGIFSRSAYDSEDLNENYSRLTM